MSLREIRTLMAIIVIILLNVGLVMIYSASGIYALEELGDKTYFLKRHVLYLFLGFIATVGVMCVDYRDLKKYSKPLLIAGIMLLILVLIPHIGTETYGARRWFRIGPFSFQPSELMKIIIIVYMADYLSRKQNKLNSFLDGFLPPMVILGLVSLLIVVQPDLGNTLLIASIVFVMLFTAGAKIKHLISVLFLTLPALIYLVVKVPYRMRRIIAFINPWEDSLGVGFQLSQSQIALGSGGFFGVGLGKSMQKLFYLPAAHTDFILSIIGEELGLVGTLSIVVLFMAFIWQGARIVKRTNNPFGYFMGVGIVAMLGFQAVVNIGVSIGAFPTKGLPLPFISYGGSALIFNMISVGLLFNISRIEEL